MSGREEARFGHQLNPIVSWIIQDDPRIQWKQGTVRITPTEENLPGLSVPTAWMGVGQVLDEKAATQLEIVVPEDADGVLKTATGQLAQQGCQFLALNYEAEMNGTRSVVATFRVEKHDQARDLGRHYLRQETTGQLWTIAQYKETILGRGKECDVQLSAPRVSSRHGSIRFARRAFVLVDLRSTGTQLDNLPIQYGIVEDFGLICLGSKQSGHYVEMELTIPPGASAFLHVISGEQAGRTIPLLQSVTTLGRASHCDMQIDAPFISREHLPSGSRTSTIPEKSMG